MDRYDKLNKIGEGAYGEVFWAEDKYQGGRDALKKLKGGGEDIVTELKVLMKLEHPGIVCLKGLIHSKDGGSYLQMEYCDGGNLDQFWKTEKPDLTTKHQFMKEMATAVAYLHKNTIAHRDLKPENILIAHVDDNHHIKIADFGLATSKSANENSYMTEKVGTRFFTAPEVHQENARYNALADIFSLGVIFRAMVFDRFISIGHKRYLGDCYYSDGKYPIPYGEVLSANMKLVVKTPEAALQNSAARNLLDSMMSAHYKNRPTAAKVGCQIVEETKPSSFTVSKRNVRPDLIEMHSKSHQHDSGYHAEEVDGTQDAYLKRFVTTMREVSTGGAKATGSAVELSHDQLHQTRNLVKMWENMISISSQGTSATSSRVSSSTMSTAGSATSKSTQKTKPDTNFVVQTLDRLQEGKTITDSEMKNFAHVWTELDDIFQEKAEKDKEEYGLRTVVNFRPSKN